MYAMPRLIILVSLYILFICLSHLPKKKLDLKSNTPARCSPCLNKRTEPDDSDDDFMDPPVPASKRQRTEYVTSFHCSIYFISTYYGSLLYVYMATFLYLLYHLFLSITFVCSTVAENPKKMIKLAINMSVWLRRKVATSKKRRL